MDFVGKVEDSARSLGSRPALTAAISAGVGTGVGIGAIGGPAGAIIGGATGGAIGAAVADKSPIKDWAPWIALIVAIVALMYFAGRMYKPKSC